MTQNMLKETEKIFFGLTVKNQDIALMILRVIKHTQDITLKGRLV